MVRTLSSQNDMFHPLAWAAPKRPVGSSKPLSQSGATPINVEIAGKDRLSLLVDDGDGPGGAPDEIACDWADWVNMELAGPGGQSMSLADLDWVNATSGWQGPEIGLHFLKDRWWDEDHHQTRRPGLSACLAAIHNAAISIHRLRSNPQLPVRAADDYIAWNPELGLKMLNL